MNRKRNLPKGISVLSLRLPSDVHDGLRESAKRNERTVSQEARLAIARHVESEKAAA